MTAAGPPTYERLTAARNRLLSAAMLRVPLASLAQQARALSLWDGKRVAPGGEAQLALVLDLGVLDPLGGHTRGLDRHAKAAPPEPESDEAVALDALATARFGLWRILGPDALGGARLAALADEAETVRVMDRGLPQADPAAPFVAMRLMRPAGADFAMTCGALAALDARAVERLLRDAPPARGPVVPCRPAPDDAAAMGRLLAEPAARLRLRDLLRGPAPGLAAKAYRHALDLGLMGPVPGRTPAEFLPPPPVART